LFDENYGLAATQNLKNKDIPEGGAKGTILPVVGADYKEAFRKYVDVRYLLSASRIRRDR
jgi:glutamate dehydrogenase